MQVDKRTVVDGKYEVLKTLGAGAFGEVYLARQTALNRLVALKILHPGLANTEAELSQRFRQEARVLSALKHRNLALFYGYGIWNLCPYIAMELVQGETLQSILVSRTKLSAPQTLEIMKQVCGALSCAHANGVVHRDLKPNNIMVCQGPAGEPNYIKVIDFGLAKVLTKSSQQSQAITQTGFTVGTFHYMSPEQCQAKPIDSRSDIYSAGCILQRCLTGTPPFDGDSESVLRQHLFEAPAALDASLPKESFPPGLQLILNKALAKVPDERYQTVQDMLFDLEVVSRSIGGSSKSAVPLIAVDAKPPVSLSTQVPVLSATKPKSRLSMRQTAFFSLAIPALATAGYFGLSKLSPKPSGASTSLDYATMARHTEESGKFIDSISMYRRALETNNRDHLISISDVASMHRHLCYILNRAGRADQAEKTALEGIHVLIDQARFGKQLAQLCSDLTELHVGRREIGAGIAELTEVVNAFPNQNSDSCLMIKFRLAQLYLKNADARAYPLMQELKPASDLIGLKEEFAAALTESKMQEQQRNAVAK